MTNVEKIKAMSDWELAEFIYKVSCMSTKISTCTDFCESCEMSDGYCIESIGEWLQMEVSDGENE